MNAHTTNRGRSPLGLGVALLVAALIGGVVGGLIVHFTANSKSANAATTSGGSSCAVTSVALKALPSVVTISVRGPTSGDTGSGELIRSGGYILTNNHVVAAAASGGTITVLFNDGKTSPARIVGRDPLADLAVIKVSNTQGAPVLPLGTSSNLKVGEPIVVLGAPLGLSSTVTTGIVSALDRTITVPGENDSQAVLIDAIQTDASINPGNSGGAMVNCSGQLVGVPSAGATVPTATGEQSGGGSIGLGFAIPADLAATISNELISTGRANHAYLGLSAEPLSPDASSQVGTNGLLVNSVASGGPAARAGIRVGDLITSIDGTEALNTSQLVELSLRQKPGSTITLDVVRAGRKSTVNVTLGTTP